MKSLEIILRLIDKLLAYFINKKAQNERDILEENPSNWFTTHFSNGVSSDTDKTNKTNSTSTKPN